MLNIAFAKGGAHLPIAHPLRFRRVAVKKVSEWKEERKLILRRKNLNFFSGPSEHIFRGGTTFLKLFSCFDEIEIEKK